jgi:ubiquinone/menaquinone biosynthesis C-methylase UbiE
MDEVRMSEASDEVQAGIEQVRAYWEGRARARLPDLEKLEWAHRRTQRLRFEAFLLDHDLAGKSVLDVGCGLADFYAHLRQRGVSVDYTGYDISTAMIQLCRARYRDQHFVSGNFLEYEPASRFDYTVAFGIHNIRVPGGRSILEQVTRQQFALAGIAAHVSLLTDRYPSFAPHLQSWSVEEVLAMALNISPHVALHHDYLPNDFSVTLYREAITRSRLAAVLKYDHE